MIEYKDVTKLNPNAIHHWLGNIVQDLECETSRRCAVTPVRTRFYRKQAIMLTR